jgi:hypothetical protein
VVLRRRNETNGPMARRAGALRPFIVELLAMSKETVRFAQCLRA